MSSKIWLRILPVGAGLLLASLGIQAQILIRPIGFPSAEHKAQQIPFFRTDNDKLSLPFWDDFSNPGPGPDERWWMPESRVWVNQSMAISPISLGTATFDGARADGTPYVLTGEPRDFGDSLVSRPIDLARLSTTEQSSLVLSFHWQKQGRGELPDEEDVFQLLFKRADGTWELVWEVDGLDDGPVDQFVYESIQLDNPAWWHADFQFLFRSRANLGGPFDTWNLDYVWLDVQRKANAGATKDRTIQSLPEGRYFGNYSRIPADWLREGRIETLDTLSLIVGNLDSLLQPLEYDLVLQISGEQTQTRQLHDGTVVEPIVQGFESRRIPLFPFILQNLPTGDSLDFDFFFRLQSGDQGYRRPDGRLFPALNYGINDTLRFGFLLEKALAYDDGTAEFSIGITQNAGRVAVLHPLTQPDVIEAVDIHFPFIPGGQENRRMELIIYTELLNGDRGILSRHTINVPPYAGRDVFTRFVLPRPVPVEGDFYLGWQHIGSLPVSVGLDKSRTLSGRIYANTSGSWEELDDVGGVLMIRPVMNASVITSLPVPTEQKLEIFPNPAMDILHWKGIQGTYQVLNMLGQVVLKGTSPATGLDASSLDLSSLKAGVYILQVRNEDLALSAKFVKR
jgi:hypothetical protein